MSPGRGTITVVVRDHAIEIVIGAADVITERGIDRVVVLLDAQIVEVVVVSAMAVGVLCGMLLTSSGNRAVAISSAATPSTTASARATATARLVAAVVRFALLAQLAAGVDLWIDRR